MKKQESKLGVRRETLQHPTSPALSERELAKAAGGTCVTGDPDIPIGTG